MRPESGSWIQGNFFCLWVEWNGIRFILMVFKYVCTQRRRACSNLFFSFMKAINVFESPKHKKKGVCRTFLRRWLMNSSLIEARCAHFVRGFSSKQKHWLKMKIVEASDVTEMVHIYSYTFGASWYVKLWKHNRELKWGRGVRNKDFVRLDFHDVLIFLFRMCKDLNAEHIWVFENGKLWISEMVVDPKCSMKKKMIKGLTRLEWVDMLDTNERIVHSGTKNIRWAVESMMLVGACKGFKGVCFGLSGMRGLDMRHEYRKSWKDWGEDEKMWSRNAMRTEGCLHGMMGVDDVGDMRDEWRRVV